MNQDVSEGEFRVEQFLSKANKVKKKKVYPSPVRDRMGSRKLALVRHKKTRKVSEQAKRQLWMLPAISSWVDSESFVPKQRPVTMKRLSLSRGGWAPCHRTVHPFCCYAKTAALTGTVPLFTHQPQTYAWPRTKVGAAFSFLLLMSTLPLKYKGSAIFFMKLALFLWRCKCVQSPDDFRSKEYGPWIPMWLITVKHGLHL